MSRSSIAVALACAAACGSETEDVHGTFAFRCLDLDDVACRGLPVNTSAPMPQAIAVNANFIVEYQSPVAGTLHAIALTSSQRGRVLGDGSIFLDEPGVHTLMAKELITERLSDLIHVSAFEVVEAVLSLEPGIDASPLGSITLTGPDPVTLYSRAVNKHGVALAGSLLYIWAVGDTSICGEGFVDQYKHQVILTPLANGSTDLTVGVSFDGTITDAVVAQLSLVVQGLP